MPWQLRNSIMCLTEYIPLVSGLWRLINLQNGKWTWQPRENRCIEVSGDDEDENEQSFEDADVPAGIFQRFTVVVIDSICPVCHQDLNSDPCNIGQKKESCDVNPYLRCVQPFRSEEHTSELQSR